MWKYSDRTDLPNPRNVGFSDGGTAAFELIALLTFTSMEALKAALASFGSEILGDIPNYTNVQPSIQVNQALGD